jgi:predicted phosphodiesterase
MAAAGSAGLVSAKSLLADETQQGQSGQGLQFSAGSGPDGPALLGNAVVSGPSPESITILQPLQRHATGYLEYSVGDGSFERVDAASAGLQPFEQHVLKFQLPPLPPGQQIRYRITARTVGWVPVRQFVHGRIVTGTAQTSQEQSFRTLDPDAASTQFVVWNDTHENEATLKSLQQRTAEISPDFMLWNGDQTNDVHFEADMAGQVLAPYGLNIADRWPLAYVRGNHDVRGPAARHLAEFTGTPEDRFYYAFRSGPVAALVMDTGEDKADDHPNFGGLAAFQQLRERQAEWLTQVISEPWFRQAPFKVLFCHLPLWWVRDRKDIDWWEFSKVSRDAWLDSLLAGGVSLVISGHTHSAQWMPASADQPIGQLTGGGPHPQYATLIHGTATNTNLQIRMSKLDGTLLHDLSFAANQ